MAEKPRNSVAIARAYAGAVVAGEIPACKWTIKACERQLEDLKRQKSKEWPYKFDPDKASRVCRFIEKLPHIKGDWAKHGGRIRLQPWQVFILTAVFGWVHKKTLLRRFRIVYIGCNGGETGIPTPEDHSARILSRDNPCRVGCPGRPKSHESPLGRYHRI